MAPKLSELKNMTDEEIEKKYDEFAKNTCVGTGFYLDELNRRASQRINESMLKLTIVMTILTVAMLVLTAVNVGMLFL